MAARCTASAARLDADCASVVAGLASQGLGGVTAARLLARACAKGYEAQGEVAKVTGEQLTACAEQLEAGLSAGDAMGLACVIDSAHALLTLLADADDAAQVPWVCLTTAGLCEEVQAWARLRESLSPSCSLSVPGIGAYVYDLNTLEVWLADGTESGIDTVQAGDVSIELDGATVVRVLPALQGGLYVAFSVPEGRVEPVCARVWAYATPLAPLTIQVRVPTLPFPCACGVCGRLGVCVCGRLGVCDGGKLFLR